MYVTVRDLNSESGDAFEGRGRTADCKKPCALPQNIKIQEHRLPSVLRKGTLLYLSSMSMYQPHFIAMHV